MPTAPSQVKQETRRYDKKNAMFLAAFPFYKKSVVKFVLKFVGKCKKTNKQTNRTTKISGLCCLCAQGRQEAEYIRNIAYVYEEVFSDLQRSALNAFLE